MPASNPATPGVAVILAPAGAIPFIAGTALLWIGSPVHASLVTNALSTYAAIILSFLGGAQWGAALSINASAPRSARTLFMLSVIVPLSAWAMVFVDTDRHKLIIAVGLFALLWVIDALLHLQQLIPAWFFRLRSIVTAVVAMSLLMAVGRI
jgi:Protein of unknown function (DUF3429)